ncbi:MAG: glycosyltransferase family 39 protein [Gaiellaceae bacterium]
MLFLLLLGALLVLVAAGIGAAFLAPGSTTAFLLAAYLLGFTEIIVCSLALSPSRSLTGASLLVLLAVVALAAVAAAVRWRPSPPPLAASFRRLLAGLRDPVLAALAAVVACGFAYTLALALLTPQNDDDGLLYHLPRAALWRQHHAIAYVSGIFHEGVNFYPPFAEIGMLFTMLLSGGDRFVGLVQLLAVVMLTLTVYGIGRRLGLALRPALFGALLVPTLPVIALQASTALNDAVVATLLTVSVYFLLGKSRTDLMLAALALGLALGTKFTAIIALPLVILIAAFAQPPRRWLRTALAGVAGSLAGSVWYFVNLYETGTLSGGGAGKWQAGNDAVRGGGSDALFPVARTGRLLSELFDLSGGIGRDKALYLVVAAALGLAGLGIALRRRSRTLGLATAAAVAIVAVAIVLPTVQNDLVRAQWKVWHALGRHSIDRLTHSRLDDATRADPFSSWFGPLGLLIPLAAIVLMARACRRRAKPPIALALALAPLVWIVIIALTLDTYQDWTGRWVIFGMALAAATFGGTLSHHPIAWATVAIAGLTLLLVFVNYQRKPSGVTLLRSASERSVWEAPRWRLQSVTRPGTAGMLRIVQERIPANATVALANTFEEPTYPFFGPRLSRTILFVKGHRTPPASAGWLVVSPVRSPALCSGDWWLVARTPAGWRIYRRTGHDTCGR